MRCKWRRGCSLGSPDASQKPKTNCHIPRINTHEPTANTAKQHLPAVPASSQQPALADADDAGGKEWKNTGSALVHREWTHVYHRALRQWIATSHVPRTLDGDRCLIQARLDIYQLIARLYYEIYEIYYRKIFSIAIFCNPKL